MSTAPMSSLVEVVARAISQWMNNAKLPAPPNWERLQEPTRRAYRQQAQAALDACHAEEMRTVLEIMHGGMLCLLSVAPEDMKAKMKEYADLALALLAKLDGKP